MNRQFVFLDGVDVFSASGKVSQIMTTGETELITQNHPDALKALTHAMTQMLFDNETFLQEEFGVERIQQLNKLLEELRAV